jgi:hypothetical protein
MRNDPEYAAKEYLLSE